MYPQLLILRSPTVLLRDGRASCGTVLHFCPASWRLVRKNPGELLSLACWEPYLSCAGSLLCPCCVSIGYTSPQERLGRSVFTSREWSWTSTCRHHSCLTGCSCCAFPTIVVSCRQRSAVDTEWDLSWDQKCRLRLSCENLRCRNIWPVFFFFNLYLLFLMVWEGCIGKFW